jgi:predicted AlkP superfamily pyrophosphatase or phosphodiesterase
VIVPAYGSSTIGDLLPSVGAHLGVPGCEADVLGLPAADRYVVVLVDGLGWELVRGAVHEAPYLASLLGEGRPITAGAPSTTVTSLASLGTGLPPGQHGMVGYTSRVPTTGEILNALTWESDLVARSYQSKATVFERALAAGVAVGTVALERFEFSGLTEAGLRGPHFVGYSDERATEVRIALTVETARRGERSLVYAYERELDHTGHVQGSGSALWRKHLTRIDRMIRRLREALPDDVVLIVTGDHGMLDIPPWHQIVAEDSPELMAGVDALAGEGRFRQLYVDRESPAAVASRWADRLGDKAWVRRRDDAVEEGWFGPVDPALVERWGHVLVAMRSDWAVMTRQFPRELTLVGMHGSLTPAEMTVPLLVG